MDVIRRGQRLSKGEIAEAVGISRPTAISRLGALRDIGFIEWIGKIPERSASVLAAAE